MSDGRSASNAKFGLSADQERALEKLLREKGVGASELLATLLRDENKAVLGQLVAQTQITVPLTLISQQQIGSLEAICRHLRNTRTFTYAQIGRLLGRDARTVWASCSKANASGAQITMEHGAVQIPLAVLADEQLSILEAVVVHLREDLGYKPFQIAELLDRDQRVVATIWQRAMRKRALASTDRTEVDQ